MISDMASAPAEGLIRGACRRAAAGRI